MREIRQPLLLPRHRLRKCRNSQHGSLIRWHLTPQCKPRRRKREKEPERTYVLTRYQTLNARTVFSGFKNRRADSTRTAMILATHHVESGGPNEDRLLVERHGERTLAIVCDGAGNGGKGAVAAELAVAEFARIGQAGF